MRRAPAEAVFAFAAVGAGSVIYEYGLPIPHLAAVACTAVAAFLAGRKNFVR